MTAAIDRGTRLHGVGLAGGGDDDLAEQVGVRARLGRSGLLRPGPVYENGRSGDASQQTHNPSTSPPRIPSSHNSYSRSYLSSPVEVVSRVAQQGR